MFMGLDEEELEFRYSESVGDRIAEAMKKIKGKVTAEKMAKTAYAVLREMSAEQGQNPDIETFIKTPKESHDFMGGQGGIWIVCWESGPYEWAISASMKIGEATGKLCEPYWSFDLAFYPSEDKA